MVGPVALTHLMPPVSPRSTGVADRSAQVLQGHRAGALDAVEIGASGGDRRLFRLSPMYSCPTDVPKANGCASPDLPWVSVCAERVALRPSSSTVCAEGGTGQAQQSDKSLLADRDRGPYCIVVETSRPSGLLDGGGQVVDDARWPSGCSMSSSTTCGSVKVASSALVSALSALHRARVNSASLARACARHCRQHPRAARWSRVEAPRTGQREDLVGPVHELGLQGRQGGVHPMVQSVQTSGSLRQVQHEQHDDHHNQDDHPGVHYIPPVGSGQAADELTAHIVLDLLARRGDAFMDLFDLAGDNLQSNCRARS